MLNSTLATRGMVVAPHSLAAQSGLAILREGGNAIEAAIATAATLAVVYPHMTGIGGDAFWLAKAPGADTVGIDAAGRVSNQLGCRFYTDRGHDVIPTRGPLAANSVAGAVSAWGEALALSQQTWQGRMPLSRILADAIEYAEHGYPVTDSQARTTDARRDELADLPGFSETFLDGGQARSTGQSENNPALATTLRRLVEAGIDDFYRGDLAQSISAELSRIGSPLTPEDLAGHEARQVPPLSVPFAKGRLYNTAPPTQGLASLMILALFERAGGLEVEPDSADHIHLLVEATKLAFQVRDRHVRDPRDMGTSTDELLDPAFLDELASRISLSEARPWGGAGDIGDTTWFGAIDKDGRAVSAIQSLYHEYGSGVVLRDTGIVWQNRGISFSLEPDSPRALMPGRQPFHTLNPALAELADGRLLAYGSMGGDGQPQTQSALLTRIACFGIDPQDAITRPRWLLGRTWGDNSNSLKLENRFPESVFSELRRRGHDVESVSSFNEMMGHAGALSLSPAGLMEGGADPRGNGCVAAF